MRSLFTVDMAQQGRKLMAMLEAIIAALEDFEPMRTTLRQLGRKHAEYGVTREQYRTLSTALIWALAQALEADFDPPARAAWTTAIETITETMQS